MIEPHDEKRSISPTLRPFWPGNRHIQGTLDDLQKQFLLLGYGPLLGVHDLLLFLPKLLGIKAFRIGHRLLANVVFGHETQVGLGHFNKISERSVVFDLKIPNSGLLPFPGFQINDPLLASAPELARESNSSSNPALITFALSPLASTLISGAALPREHGREARVVHRKYQGRRPRIGSKGSGHQDGARHP